MPSSYARISQAAGLKFRRSLSRCGMEIGDSMLVIPIVMMLNSWNCGRDRCTAESLGSFCPRSEFHAGGVDGTEADREAVLLGDEAVASRRNAELRSAGQPRAAVPTFSC